MGSEKHVRNMVTVVLPNPINPREKSKTRTQSQSPLTELTSLPENVPSSSKQTEPNPTLTMLEALTTSLPTLDG